MVLVKDVIQIKPDEDMTFAGCCFIVEAVYDWGVKCYMMLPNGGIVPYRVAHDAYKVVGPCQYYADADDMAEAYAEEKREQARR